eukprot:TRINITY_DN469_c0_g3_i1.p1 TRINITY_DN469_c0_g3~~TRINITY_DN469_c0_g3_i1.p1  ORF type:complete len:131 (+),score=32.24 TRINITY_DN469_c0_g3_i1:22-393(+)
MEDWEIVSDGMTSDDGSSWEMADYPCARRDSPSGFDDEVTATPTVSENGATIAISRARAAQAVRRELMPDEVPTEVQKVKKVQKPKLEVVKGGKHWQNKQAVKAKAVNSRHQYHRRSKIQTCA